MRGNSPHVESPIRRFDDKFGRSTEPGIKTLPEQRARVVELLSGLTMVIRHHGAPEKVVCSFNQQASDYLDEASESVFMKKAKYLLSTPLAIFLKQKDLPEAPAGGELKWKGSFLRWMKPRLRHYREKNVHLWFSFLQGKRSARQVSKDIVLENFQKHRQQMSCPDPLAEDVPDSDETLDQVMSLLEPLLGPLSYKMERALGDYFDNPDHFSASASNNASFESSRKMGGQSGFLRGQVRTPEMNTFGDLVQVLDGGELWGMREVSGPHLRDGHLSSASVIEIRYRPNDQFGLFELAKATEREAAEGIPRYDAAIEAVLEPLKVRTISKGPSAAYFLAKPVQKVLHSLLREEKPFRLIGQPFCPTMLMDVLQRFESNWDRDTEDENWLSVDYSAATDGLSARLSREILSRVLSRLAIRNLSLYNVMMGVLAPHRIHYPPVKTKDGKIQLEPVDQINGQLMGSILSFPVLCIANLGLYLWTKKTMHPCADWTSLYESVLLNGDDMLYIGSHAEWELHQRLGKKLGLSMSPGKAYIHKRYANINSVSVDFDLTKRFKGTGPNVVRVETHPRRVGFLNVGLFFGKHKVQGSIVSDGSDSAEEHPISASLNELLEGSREDKRNEVLRMYISDHREQLARETKGRNLFLPISVGGMGVQKPKGWRSFLTKEQREWAGALWRDLPYSHSNHFPRTCGIPLRDVEDNLIDPLAGIVECDKFRGYRKGSQKIPPDVLRFGISSYVTYSDWSDDPELGDDESEGSDRTAQNVDALEEPGSSFSGDPDVL